MVDPSISAIAPPPDREHGSETSREGEPSVPPGVAQRLDPRVITLDRIVGGITALVVAFMLLVLDLILLFTGGIAAWALVLVLPGSAAAVVLIGWLAWAWPPLEYRHASYVIDADGIEIRRGVVWRRVISVPRSRVQHIDVSQGPLERAYGLGSMSIYTAGTEYAHVGLSGLDHRVALSLRDRLLPKESADAV